MYKLIGESNILLKKSVLICSSHKATKKSIWIYKDMNIFPFVVMGTCKDVCKQIVTESLYLVLYEISLIVFI